MNVSWMPSYGPEMRGDAANCAVVISDAPIGSPRVTEPPIAVIMNKPSMTKFVPTMEQNGLMLYNTSLIDITPERTDINAVAIDCNGIAEQLGNSRSHEVLKALNTYPVLSGGAHAAPLPRKWMNMTAGILIPIGLLFYARACFFRHRLKGDLKQIVKTNKEIQNIIYERKL